MSWLSGLRQRIDETLRPGRAARDLDDELRDHFAREVDRLERGGAAPADARRLAAIRIGNRVAAAETGRDQRTGRLVADLVSDLRLALRAVRRNPGFAAAVVISLALGVGGTTAVFTLVHASLLRPLPYPDPDRLAVVRIWWNDFSARLSPADINTLHELAGEVAAVGAFFEPDDGFALATASGPELIEGAIVTDTLVTVLGVRPTHGPGFSATPNAPEALIAQSLADVRYGGARAAVGRSIVIDGDAYQIVGVMPAGYDVPGQRGAAVWLKALSRQPTRRGPFYFVTVARLAPELTPDAAAARLTALAQPVLRDRYGEKATWRYAAVPLHDTLVRNLRSTLLLLFAGIGLVLLVAIVNVASLMLARGIARTRELALRASLGAGRGRLVRHLLAEAVVLGGLGGGAGLAFAWTLLRAVEGSLDRLSPILADGRRLDLVPVLFAAACGPGAALIASIVPAIRLPWDGLALSARARGPGSVGRWGHARVREALVVSEVALTLVVVTGAALLGRSLLRLQSIDPGFVPEGVASFRLTLPDTPYEDDARRAAFTETLTERLRANPGVGDVALAFSLPPNLLTMTNNYTLEGSLQGAQGHSGVAEWNVVSPSYFSTLGIRLIDGRAFNRGDSPGGPRVAIVNDSFVRRHFPDRPAMGARLKGGHWSPEAPWLTIVGVVADVPYGKGLWGGADDTVYVPHAQNLWMQSLYVLVRTAGDSAVALADARRTVAALDPALPIRDPASMTGRLHQSIAEPRLRAQVFALIGGLALALAVTGIYGVMAYHVQRRRHEHAIRRALGATSRNVMGETLRMGVRMTAVGVVLGALGAYALARALSSVLFEVQPRDPASFALGASLLVGTALLACAIPALYSARVDPAELLRVDQ